MECTHNRVGDQYFDQLDRTGHSYRSSDLDLFAGLGLATLRYPVLWERVAPGRLERADWSWPDERLGRLRTLGVRPIVGLVHHGSGPRHTSLLDPGFAAGLAGYARQAAWRYPWVDAYTPVNEPLTTARFSALYGHWYPHRRDDASFVTALVNQCRATVLAMAAIRHVRPDAALVTTEDLGHVHATPALSEQADFENERRWLSIDLLCGHVDRGHPLRGWLLRTGLAQGELDWFLDNPCPPDVIGFNHYVTSERFLDDDLSRWPVSTHGSNGRMRYADVAAVRAGRRLGLAALLELAWRRFRRPLAVTEVHLGCTREQQLRWLWECWGEAQRAADSGVDVRAVTAWSLLGSYDWHALVCRHEGRYEPGVFDVRSRVPRPTALAGLVRALAAGETPTHPVLAGHGWWRSAFDPTEEAPYHARDRLAG
jgi:dTDP-4-dehydrorhamnose reductase